LIDNAAKTFDILAISLIVPQKYFNGSTELFLDFYLAKFLNTLVKPHI